MDLNENEFMDRFSILRDVYKIKSETFLQMLAIGINRESREKEKEQLENLEQIIVDYFNDYFRLRKVS